jgi:BASS family bile acid:Na+ symporter
MGPFHLISRYGTRIIAVAVVVGLFVQPLAAVLRPYIGDFVVVMLTVSLLRTDLAALLERVRKPLRVVAGAAFVSVVLPLVVLTAATAWGPPLSAPVVLAVIFLFTVPPPIVSAPALAFLMGLDGTLVLAVMLTSTVAMPVTAPAIASLFVADTLPIGALDLAVRLAGIIGVSVVAATVLRALLGQRRIAAARPLLDTVGVTIAGLFAIGAMDSVGVRVVEDPLFTLAAGIGAFAIGVAQMAVTYAAFRPFTGPDAVAIAYAAASRNAGVVVAALGVMALDDTLWLFFALSQLPIFILPLALEPVSKRLLAGGEGRSPSRSPS